MARVVFDLILKNGDAKSCNDGGLILKGKGIICTACGNETLEVFYTRKGDKKVIRMRRCPKCKTRHLTSERVVAVIHAKEKV